ncbi:MAG: T9SS type A sorting domain-containing protein, partial [Psychroserpens sp.]|nr:T9SS type A sorting domain-containing protein [Psychroserpens sp.]
RHGGSNEARVPWFDGTTPTNPRVGTTGSPTTGIQFRGNTAIAGVYIQGDALGSSMNGKYLFTDYVRNWINIATLTDGTQNHISDISELAPINFGDGIVHMIQNPMDGFIYYVNILNGTLTRISFQGPEWTNQPENMVMECDSAQNINDEFNNWLNSFSGTVTCGNPTVTNDATGLDLLCGDTTSETVTFTLADECGNIITRQVSFSVEDNTGPVFNETLPADESVSCGFVPASVTLTANDSCSTANVSFQEDIANGSCDGAQIITRTWTATDDCNNETIHQQIITVTDTVDPVWTNAPTDLTVDCSVDYQEEFDAWLTSFSGSDNCSTAVINTNAPVSIGCPQVVIVDFDLVDDCGNMVSASATFTAQETLGLTDSNLEAIRIYPNPAKDQLNFEGLQQETTVMIYNILGKRILETRVKDKLNLSLRSGLYIVVIQQNESSITKKLIID